jgi:hypothetical protein
MKKCPYCAAEIPDEALKCMHCGEWVERPPEIIEREREEASLGRAANRWVNLQILGIVLGCGIPLVAAIVAAVVIYFFVPWK